MCKPKTFTGHRVSTKVFFAINGPVENMNKGLCGLVRCFRIYLREKAKLEITIESELLPWLVRHCGWILSRYAVRADGRTGYSRLKGRECTSGIAIFGEAIWYKLPKTAATIAGALRFSWRSRTEAMSTSSDWRMVQSWHDQFDGKSKASAGMRER